MVGAYIQDKENFLWDDRLYMSLDYQSESVRYEFGSVDDRGVGLRVVCGEGTVLVEF